VGALAVSVPFVTVTLERHQVDTLAERLAAEARLAGAALPWTTGAPLDAACVRLAGELGVRLTVIAPDGRVLGESSRGSEGLASHADRPEVRAALAVGRGRSVRQSTTVDGRLLYVAWRQHGAAEGRVVRVALPLTAVAESVAQVRRLVLAGVAIALLLGLGAALAISRRMVRRIQHLVAFAEQLAAGGAAPYLAPERHDDVGVLEAQLGNMARQIVATIGELRVERERLEAILRGMVEGVLVTDLDGRVVLMNERARELLRVPPGMDGRGRPLIELTRDPALAELPRELGAGPPALSRDVCLRGGSGPTLQVNAARLRGADGNPFGFLLVLHDVTELRRLEVIRRDFVANVSHELRTPLTAIKGYAETLLGSAGDDRAIARRFLEVIDRHSERLGRLIDDLLALSDLELGRTPLHLGAVSVAVAVDDVLEILAERIARAGVQIGVHIAPSTPPVLADGDRLRQVLINLVDNAIKFTTAGGRVMVRASAADGSGRPGFVEIAVEDTGIGIPAQDLPRLTERFFRVDKARSRELGGTGLGLAIVKHIVGAHGGSLAIESTLGQGTTVRVTLPAVAPAGPAHGRA
jgi:two-component system phosphate regulon sensor histidine kinase PhoR